MDTDSFHQRKRSYGVYVHARLRGYKVDRKENLNQRITAREWILNNFQNYSKRASCIQECATSLGISVRNARKAMIGVEKSGKVTWDVKIDGSTSEVNFDENGLAHISLLSNIPRSVEDLMAISKLDPELWFVKQQIVNFSWAVFWAERNILSTPLLPKSKN